MESLTQDLPIARGNGAPADSMSAEIIGILDTIDLPIVVVGHDCTVARFNQAAAEALGLTVSDLGQRPRNIRALNEFREIETLCQQVIGDAAPLQRQVRSADRWFQLRIAPYTGSDGESRGTVLTFTNVTGFRESIGQAIYEREYLKAILNTVNDAFVVLDKELRVQTGNRTFYEIFGISREAAQGIPLNDLGNAAWNALDVWPSLRATLLDDHDFRTAEVQRDVPSGGRRTLLLDACRLSPKGSSLVLLVLRDVTERKQAEDAVRASEENYRQLVSLMPAAVYACDAEGKITFFNQRAAQLWGREPKIGDCDQRFCGALRLWRPDGTLMPHAETPMAASIREGTRTRNGDVTIERPDGTHLSVLVNIDPIFDSAGKPAGAINVFQDVTALKNAEAELKRKNSQLAAFLETAAVSLHRVGPDGTILWANDAEMKMLGYSPEEYIGHHISEFHAEEPVINDILKRLTCGQKLYGYEARLKCKDGSIKDVLIDSSVLWEDGRFIHTQCFTRDITEKKRAEESLRLISRFPAENPAPLLRVSREKILHLANPAAYQLLSEWNVRVGDPAPAAVLKLIGDGERHDAEVSIGERCYAVVVVPVLQGEFINLYFADITARKRAEQTLREMNERLKKVLEVETVGVMFWDLTTGCLVDANDTFLKMMGYSRAEVESRSLTWQKFTPPEYHDLSRAEVAKFMITGRVGPYEKEYFHKDGTRQWLLFAGSSLGDNQCVEFCVDISERKKIEQALRESEERYRATFENAAVGIAHVGLDGRWLRLNDAVCAITGYTREELARLTFTDITHPDDIEQDWQHARQLIDGEISRYAIEKRYIRKDGSCVWIMLTVSLMRNSVGKPLHFVSVIENIDEKKRAGEILEQTVAERTASLREAVEQMEEFSYSVSHDLRGPLRAMSAYARVLLEEYGNQLDQTARGYLEKIQRSGDRMDRLTQEVLAYSRVARSKAQAEAIDLNGLVRDVIHQHTNFQPPAARIEIVSPLPAVLGHETTLGQSVSNLLNNAVKFVGPGVRPHVRVRAEHNGKTVRVWFEDNGIGIKPEHQQRIFNMFERVHPEGMYEGTGIGLTIVRKAVEKMGGKVGVESDGQNGSRFWIELRHAE